MRLDIKYICSECGSEIKSNECRNIVYTTATYQKVVKKLCKNCAKKYKNKKR